MSKRVLVLLPPPQFFDLHCANNYRIVAIVVYNASQCDVHVQHHHRQILASNMPILSCSLYTVHLGISSLLIYIYRSGRLFTVFSLSIIVATRAILCELARVLREILHWSAIDLLPLATCEPFTFFHRWCDTLMPTRIEFCYRIVVVSLCANSEEGNPTNKTKLTRLN